MYNYIKFLLHGLYIMTLKNNDNICSFCSKRVSGSELFFTSCEDDKIGICNLCIQDCSEYQKNSDDDKDSKFKEDIKSIKALPPKEIFSYLNEHIVGQDKAKKYLAVSIYNHFVRTKYLLQNNRDSSSFIDIEKSNILMLGPTGCGKTAIIKKIAELLELPVSIADATSITESGYVGDDVETILSQLISSSDGDVKKAEFGIVYIDEIDKLRKSSDNASISRDVSGQGVQQALLKLVEGTTAHIPSDGSRKHPEDTGIKLNTKNILFIIGGAFEDIEKIVNKRINKSSISFQNSMTPKKENSNIWELVTTEDLISYGLIKEFIGRFPVLIDFHKLTESNLLSILIEPKYSIIKQYKTLLKASNIDLEFEDGVLEVIAKKAYKLEIGARGLRSILEKILLDPMFEHLGSSSTKIVITKDMLEKVNMKDIVKSIKELV